jgi:hypothetical protein
MKIQFPRRQNDSNDSDSNISRDLNAVWIESIE